MLKSRKEIKFKEERKRVITTIKFTVSSIKRLHDSDAITDLISVCDMRSVVIMATPQ